MIIVHYRDDGEPYLNFTAKNIEYILSGKATIEWYLEN